MAFDGECERRVGALPVISPCDRRTNAFMHICPMPSDVILWFVSRFEICQLTLKPTWDLCLIFQIHQQWHWLNIGWIYFICSRRPSYTSLLPTLRMRAQIRRLAGFFLSDKKNIQEIKTEFHHVRFDPYWHQIQHWAHIAGGCYDNRRPFLFQHTVRILCVCFFFFRHANNSVFHPKYK